MRYMCAERNKLRRVFSTAIDLVKAVVRVLVRVSGRASWILPGSPTGFFNIIIIVVNAICCLLIHIAYNIKYSGSVIRKLVFLCC